MKTLEEAIKHAEEVANDYENMTDDYALDSEKLHKCANEHRQLAEWLRELKERIEHGLMQGCYGCKHKPFEEKNRCRSCKRMCLDKYEPERRTDADD